MPVKLTYTAFCELVIRSGLISKAQLETLRASYLQEQSRPKAEDYLAFAEFLVRQNVLTLWQAKKLLQGRHKGFFIGKYRLLSLLGRGGMSSVYLAEHTVMRRRCAIKILPFKNVNKAAALDRFYQEARAVAALDDPNIVRAYDVDQVFEAGNEVHFLVMEYVDGRSLQQIVEEDGPLPIREAVEYVRQAAKGLAHAHSLGMVHRDVKPSNLLLDDSGIVKILDLGLARMFQNANGPTSLTIEHQQTVLGTADYLSPEQAVDSHAVDHRSDLYSLGCTLYFLLTGQPPFASGTLTQRLLAHQTQEPAPVTDFRPDVPVTLTTILKRLMAKKPEDRFRSAEEVVAVLNNWLSHHAEQFPAPSSPRAARAVQPERIPPDNVPPPGSAPVTRRRSDSSQLAKAQARRSPPAARSPGRDRSPRTPQPTAKPENLTSFLQQLDVLDERETVSPFFPIDDTIVAEPQEATASAAQPSKAVPPSLTAPARGPQRPTFEKEVVPSQSKTDLRSSKKSRSFRRSRRAALWVTALGAMICSVVGAAILWRTSESPVEPSAIPPPVGSDAPQSSVQRTPDIDPTSDITVGPEGHFQTIQEALDYVRANFQPLNPRDTRTIRVAGGQTYPERIVIDNSVQRDFPLGVQIVCDDKQPAVLEPAGTDPILDLRTVERFLLRGFTLRGSGQPTLVHLEGYLVRTVLEKLSVEGVKEVGVRLSGVTGFSRGNRCTLQNLTFREAQSPAVAMHFENHHTPTKDLLIRRCRILPGFATGLRFAGGASNIEISECIFSQVDSGIRFANVDDAWAQIQVTNCTFYQVPHPIEIERPLTSADGPFHFSKDLFVGARGAELVITGGTVESSRTPVPITASFNWTDQTTQATAPGEIDLFQQSGRRGASFEFASTDPEDVTRYLQPTSAELREVAAQITPAPQYVGAVPLPAP